MSTIESIEELEKIYGQPKEVDILKVLDYVSADYQKIIEASPMMMLATNGPEGLDCTPRGDERGFVRVVDERTLMFPDRRGNNRIDSLRNIIRDPRVAGLFLIPGIGVTLRVNGVAKISADHELLESFEKSGALPRTVITIKVKEVFFHCARSIVRSRLWSPEHFLQSSDVPTAGKILAALSDNRLGGDQYDKEWPERAKKTLW